MSHKSVWSSGNQLVVREDAGYSGIAFTKPTATLPENSSHYGNTNNTGSKKGSVGQICRDICDGHYRESAEINGLPQDGNIGLGDNVRFFPVVGPDTFEKRYSCGEDGRDKSETRGDEFIQHPGAECGRSNHRARRNMSDILVLLEHGLLILLFVGIPLWAAYLEGGLWVLIAGASLYVAVLLAPLLRNRFRGE